MREIFVNGVAFRYKSERDLGIILMHSRNPARLRPLCRLVEEVQQIKRNSNIVGTQADVVRTDGLPYA